MKPKRTILCVDDNEQSLSIRKVMLETRGYRVITCNGGEQALEIFKKGGIDLVLTDLVMPGLDGTKLVEQVKSISPQTPAILLSGKVKIYDRDTQADVFLPKGMYAPVELLERIRLLLIRKRGPKLTEPGRGGAKSGLYSRDSICCRRPMPGPTWISLSILRERTDRETGPTSLRLSTCWGWRNGCTIGLLSFLEASNSELLWL